MIIFERYYVYLPNKIGVREKFYVLMRKRKSVLFNIKQINEDFRNVRDEIKCEFYSLSITEKDQKVLLITEESKVSIVKFFQKFPLHYNEVKCVVDWRNVGELIENFPSMFATISNTFFGSREAHITVDKDAFYVLCLCDDEKEENKMLKKMNIYSKKNKAKINEQNFFEFVQDPRFRFIIFEFEEVIDEQRRFFACVFDKICSIAYILNIYNINFSVDIFRARMKKLVNTCCILVVEVKQLRFTFRDAENYTQQMNRTTIKLLCDLFIDDEQCTDFVDKIINEMNEIVILRCVAKYSEGVEETIHARKSRKAQFKILENDCVLLKNFSNVLWNCEGDVVMKIDEARELLDKYRHMFANFVM